MGIFLQVKELLNCFKERAKPVDSTKRFYWERKNDAVVDFEMPELNGRELFLRMKASGAGFPKALLTGSTDTLS
jgi:FixJ family two-component response regulator